MQYIAQVLQTLRGMRRSCPGTAYCFGYVVLNYSKYMQHPDCTREQLLDEIESNLAKRDDLLEHSKLAFRFMHLVLSDAPREDISSVGVLPPAINEIAHFGSSYRDLTNKDNEPPTSRTVERAIFQNGSKTVADAVYDIRKAGCSAGETCQETERAVANLLALFDAGEEEDARVSLPFLRQMRMILAAAESRHLRVDHLPLNEFDLAGVTAAVNRYQSVGLKADYDFRCRNDGIAVISFENPMRQDGSIAIFDVHKIARQGFLRTRAYWVVQLYSKITEGAVAMPHGCVYGSTQAVALSEAEQDVRAGFLSVLAYRDAIDP